MNSRIQKTIKHLLDTSKFTRKSKITLCDHLHNPYTQLDTLFIHYLLLEESTTVWLQIFVRQYFVNFGNAFHSIKIWALVVRMFSSYEEVLKSSLL